MQALGDLELLREYATGKSEQAFATIVSRHINLVYSVALRHAGNPHQAQDITQAVFVVLAKKAGSLRPGTVLSGWLFQAARLTARNFLRTEVRRSHREQEAYMQSTLTGNDTGAEWQQIAPLLDTAIAELGEQDRNAIVLRFVEGKDLREVGLALGSSEDAAKKRVSRAVEKLRGYFSKRGVTLSGTALAGLISANAMQAAPTGLAAIVAATAVQGTATTLTLAKGTLKLMAWTKLKIAAGVGVAALMAYQWHQNIEQTKQITALHEQMQEASQKEAKQLAAIEQLKKEKLVLVDEKLAAEKLGAKLVAHQKTAFAAEAAKTVAAANTSNAPGGALAKLMDDPAMKEFMRQQQLTLLKTQYAPLIKSLNLSPEAADKFRQLLSDDAIKRMQLGMAVMKGDMDTTAAKQAQTDAKTELTNQLQSLLGADGYAEYDQFKQDVSARMIVKALNDQMGDKPLNEDQNSRLMALMKAEPKASDPDQFAGAGAMDQHLQRQAEQYQHVYQQASEFLAPEQLAGLGTYQTNMLNMMRMGMSMKEKFMGSNKAKP